jgi:hypothetical protein
MIQYVVWSAGQGKFAAISFEMYCIYLIALTVGGRMGRSSKVRAACARAARTEKRWEEKASTT